MNIGNSGTTRMTDDGIWWSSDYYFYRINIYQDNLLNVARYTPSHTDGTIDDAAYSWQHAQIYTGAKTSLITGIFMIYHKHMNSESTV